MRTKNRIRHLAWGVLGLVNQQVFSQASQADNNGGATSFLGWNAGANQILDIRNNANQPIDFYTSALGRARLMPTGTATINTFTNVAQNGFFLLSGTADYLTNANNRAPFTRLHLVDPQVSGTNQTVYAQEFGYRTWQRNGITFTGNRDHAYVGQRYWGNDQTDFVVQWADNAAASPWGTDRMKFVFTSAFNPGSTRGATSDNGLEAMRLFPVDLLQVNVGIGDFSQPGLAQPDPTERLDILDGRLRIRELPLVANQNESLLRYMVVDDNGLVQWRNLPAAATPNCDWDLNSGGLLLATSWRNPGTNGNCPDRRWVTGIGTSSPSGKLHVVHNATERAVDSGVKVGYTANSASAGQCFGIQSTVSPSGSVVPSPFGVHSTVTNPSSSGTALFGRVTANGNVTGASSAYGQVGEVRLSSSAVVATSVGSRGYVELASGSTSTEVIGSQGVAAVSNASGSVSNAYGLLGDASVGTGVVTNVFGLKANAGGTGTITNSYGAWTESTNTGAGMQNSFGLRSRGVSGTTSNYGVFALAQGNTNPSNNFGLFAQLTLGTNTSGQNYAGYFQGNMHVAGLASCTNSVWSSDQSLKTDITDLTGARELLLQLRPKDYRFRTEEMPYANLPEGLQHGVIAQELEEVMPELVQEIKLAAVLNEEGEELQAARTIKAVNYIGLIPVLIGAMQDQQHQLYAQQSAVAQQQATVDELRAQLEDQRQELARAQERIAACCFNPDAGRSLQQGLAAPEELFGADPKLRIQPNPFNERTSVFYSVEKSGRTQLLANSADGKELRVLHEAQLEAGQYQYEWDTTELAAGMYYVTLLLDGQPVVKKAVKVAR